VDVLQVAGEVARISAIDFDQVGRSNVSDALVNHSQSKVLSGMNKKQRKATKIMLIRHAEKPAKDFVPYGVTRKGERDKESLQVRGWQRAGALIGLFAPPSGQVNSSLARPQFLYASKPLRRRGSRRPFQTLIPLGEKLGIEINTNFPRFAFEKMLEEIYSCKGAVLICWQREYIPAIALKILDDRRIAPADWPEDCYDMVWVFDLHRSSGQYRFKQVPQKLLAGDATTPIGRQPSATRTKV